ncbi:tRNA pseudouridine(55) synthase TruB [Pseudoxanthomonas sp. Root630]|uniref:tRNA pseudouridine(55) synthase TruB n=1 Tax=Pseudoxanthomonas sp. Root630 TaxID=1736574 RepID=UPI000702B09D|nr:tRNA pseudouridine(55) synthase TruB [Pseudoxanthomonas sp. Root630]KRA42432.1 tRNA pseudouridine synthase B [Pseudoxanthomonas sp. Root630]
MSLPKLKFRPLDGLLLLDKPQGMSSNAALQVARRLFRAEKGGHTGSLDPLATGLLPLCFGEATKIAGLLLGSRKAYDTVAVLGTTTDTDDADGAPLRERPLPALDTATVQAALAPLMGRIRQRAPIYSALKQGGEPLYAKARRGEAIEAPERDVEVHALDILEIAPGRIALRVECGSGTYVRSLVRDLGETLGCGAHVGALRRLWVEPFRQPRMFTLEALQALAAEGGEAALDACLLPIEAGLTGFPRIDVDAEGARRLGQGQRLQGQPPCEGPAAVHGPDGRVLGLATVDPAGVLSPQRLFTWTAHAALPMRGGQ